jgi:hypothetical protein
MDAGMQVLEIPLKVLLVVLTCQPIDRRCSILLEFKECLLEVIDTDVVEERGELLLLPLPCSLPYALQISKTTPCKVAGRSPEPTL